MPLTVIIFTMSLLGIIEYVNAIGYVCNPGTNIADFAMDVLHGVVVHKSDVTLLSVEKIIQKVCFVGQILFEYTLHMFMKGIF